MRVFLHLYMHRAMTMHPKQKVVPPRHGRGSTTVTVVVATVVVAVVDVLGGRG